ncbi:MAG: hypothetical protein EAX86_10960 [Candidatus Heimdallarchaeota archaeon]|nr:hypothetical protein [Candidatus Heimdallarchaeota archaeon]
MNFHQMKYYLVSLNLLILKSMKESIFKWNKKTIFQKLIPIVFLVTLFLLQTTLGIADPTLIPPPPPTGN